MLWMLLRDKKLNTKVQRWKIVEMPENISSDCNVSQSKQHNRLGNVITIIKKTYLLENMFHLFLLNRAKTEAKKALDISTKLTDN